MRLKMHDSNLALVSPAGLDTFYKYYIALAGLLQENGKTFGVYAIAVNKLFASGQSESWHIYRRYSDFYDLHQKIKERVSAVSYTHLTLPTIYSV